MQEWEEGRMISYIGLLNELKTRVSNEQTAAMILGEIARDRRMMKISAERRGYANKATQKQLRLLSKLHVDYPEGISKGEASSLIDGELGRKGNHP